MSNISLDLSNKLPGEQVNIIREVVDAAEHLQYRVFIVGAKVREFLLQYAYDLTVHRVTNDIDFAVVVESWDEFAELRNNLVVHKKFQPHKSMTHRLIHETDSFIDLIPFGGLEEVSGQISWPPDFSIVMNTVGFREAYDGAIEVRIADGLEVKVASLAGLALMKIVAWHDRCFERDAEDLGLIMRLYLDAGNQNRVYDEQGDCFDLLNEEFDYDKASARILGRAVNGLLSEVSRTIVTRVLSDKADALAMAIVRNRTNYFGDYDMARLMLKELLRGIEE